MPTSSQSDNGWGLHWYCKISTICSLLSNTDVIVVWLMWIKHNLQLCVCVCVYILPVSLCRQPERTWQWSSAKQQTPTKRHWHIQTDGWVEWEWEILGPWQCVCLCRSDLGDTVWREAGRGAGRLPPPTAGQADGRDWHLYMFKERHAGIKTQSTAADPPQLFTFLSVHYTLDSRLA